MAYFPELVCQIHYSLFDAMEDFFEKVVDFCEKMKGQKVEESVFFAMADFSEPQEDFYERVEGSDVGQSGIRVQNVIVVALSLSFQS